MPKSASNIAGKVSPPCCMTASRMFSRRTLRASGWLSLDAYRFWQQRDPSVVQWHLEVESSPGLWITPKQLLNLKAIAELKLMEGANEGQPAQ